MYQINMDKILEQINEEIKKKQFEGDMISFEDIPLISDLDAIEQMHNSFYIDWRRPVSLGIKGIIKKMIRKCVGFFVAPIAEDQTKFNWETLMAIEQIFELLDKQQMQLEQRNKIIKKLEKRIAVLEEK